MSFEKHLNKLAMNTQNINLIENRMVNSTVPENGSENSVESNLYKVIIKLTLRLAKIVTFIFFS